MLRFWLFIIGVTSGTYVSFAQRPAQDFTEPVSDVESMLPVDIPTGMSWQLVFNDEFDQAKIDRSKWKFYGDEEPVPRRDGYWTSKAASPDTTGDGNLIMHTLENDTTYYSSCLHTEGIFEPLYGYFEIRVDLHEEEGHWPAFWLYSGDVFRIGKGGVDGAELDIFEKFKTNRKVEHNIHWDGYSEFHSSAGKKFRCRKIMKGYQHFGLWWSPDSYRFYVNGELTWETTAGGICEVPLHLLISDEVGEKRRMRSIKRADLPDQWEVDYVRVYQLR